MIRYVSYGVGAIFSLALLVGAFTPRDEAHPDPVKALEKEHKEVHFAHQGIFGTYDRAQLQRGFQVYREVCSACHSLNLVAFRSLADLGYNEAEIKAIAKSYEVPAIDEKTGEATTRPALPSDHFHGPYENEVAAAAANNGKAPPDLSLIVKAREGHEAYIYSILTGYQNPPAGFDVPEGRSFNPYFPGTVIGMPKPLSDDQVTYADGTKATVDQMAKDVAAFLTWTAEPKLENRKRTGVGAIAFLSILLVLSIISYKKIWASVKGPKPHDTMA
ncbi:cytochrome c1 [Pedomonas mirosovicensis]|uniref:cytochrome c1 n=1 Tax=Pedomonas mirosovicensis TaxID=2908641 RepID=UPI002169A983|nr:cytochrome c1 [Pedomonas mirosovicensis]MCH8684681.1 cytochrome c1 [Pedomonas mirosovicensis]